MVSLFVSACLLALLTVLTRATSTAVLLRRLRGLSFPTSLWLSMRRLPPHELVAGIAAWDRNHDLFQKHKY